MVANQHYAGPKFSISVSVAQAEGLGEMGAVIGMATLCRYALDRPDHQFNGGAHLVTMRGRENGTRVSPGHVIAIYIPISIGHRTVRLA